MNYDMTNKMWLLANMPTVIVCLKASLTGTEKDDQTLSPYMCIWKKSIDL